MIVLVQSRKTKRDKFFVCLWRNNNSYNYWSDSVLDASPVKGLSRMQSFFFFQLVIGPRDGEGEIRSGDK